MWRMSRIETLGVHRGGDRRGRGDAAGLIVDRQRGGAPLHWSVWTLQRPCRFVTRAGNVRLLPLSSVDSHNYGTHGDLRFRYRGRSWGSWKCRKTQVPADLRTEADRLDDLVHALADHFGRKVVLVWPDDKEVVVEPRPELRLDG